MSTLATRMHQSPFWRKMKRMFQQLSLIYLRHMPRLHGPANAAVAKAVKMSSLLTKPLANPKMLLMRRP